MKKRSKKLAPVKRESVADFRARIAALARKNGLAEKQEGIRTEADREAYLAAHPTVNPIKTYGYNHWDVKDPKRPFATMDAEVTRAMKGGAVTDKKFVPKLNNKESKVSIANIRSDTPVWRFETGKADQVLEITPNHKSEMRITVVDADGDTAVIWMPAKAFRALVHWSSAFVKKGK